MMQKIILALGLMLCFGLACNPAGTNGLNSNPNANEPGEGAKQIPQEGRRERIFVALLQGLHQEDPKAFMQEFYRLYALDRQGGEFKTLRKIALQGQTDSLWWMECQFAADTRTCAEQSDTRQFIFDAKGHLLWEEQAQGTQLLSIWPEENPLLLVWTANCEGQGSHRLYRLESGELINILNPMEEPSPPTVNSRLYKNGVLELSLRDLNRDSLPDLFFSGNLLADDPATGYRKGQQLSLAFIYRPSKEWFVWQGD